MSLRSDRQIYHHPKSTFTGQLVCPHCQSAFPITWRRYWSAPWGNYRCLECRQISYTTANFWWIWSILIVTIMLGGIVGVLFSIYVLHSGWLSIVFALMGGLAVGWIFDKWIDGHWRHLKIR